VLLKGHLFLLSFFVRDKCLFSQLLFVAFAPRTLTTPKLRRNVLTAYDLSRAEMPSDRKDNDGENLSYAHNDAKSLINHHDLDRVPLRCQRLLMCLMRFRAKAEHVPGKELVVDDTLSRNPQAALSDTSDTQEDVKAYVDAAEMERPTSPGKFEQIKCATASDPQLRRVLDYTVSGWPK